MGHFDHDGHDHAHVHEHTHTDEHGAVYTHSHEHTHEGDHQHAHGGEQTIAVLQYMLHQLLHAVDSFDQANGYLSAALELIRQGGEKR